MIPEKVSFEESLTKNVVEAGRCVGCGTCVVSCPFSCLELVQDKPNVVRECKICGICAQACPRNAWSWLEAERLVFGRERRADESFGVYGRLALARAQDQRVLAVCQDGGVVTALLRFALENGLIDAAVLAGTSPDRPLMPVPRLVTTSEEILDCAGTKYTYSPNILGLAEAVKQKKKSVAFVGTPCQIHALVKMRLSGLRKYVDPVRFTIGLMCSESFTYEGLVETHLHKRLGLDLDKIRKLNIKGKMLITTDTEVKTVSLPELKPYARTSCRLCNDFSSELADISAGGLGLDGWTFTIVRNGLGEELFSRAMRAGALRTKGVDEASNALSLLRKLSARKKQSLSHV